jgi:hypothetical protein
MTLIKGRLALSSGVAPGSSAAALPWATFDNGGIGPTSVTVFTNMTAGDPAMTFNIGSHGGILIPSPGLYDFYVVNSVPTAGAGATVAFDISGSDTYPARNDGPVYTRMLLPLGAGETFLTTDSDTWVFLTVVRIGDLEVYTS